MINKDMRFKHFILNEDHVYLSQKIGDILNAVHDLEQNVDGMGNRQLTSNAESIVNQIRRILHTSWNKSEIKYLQILQKAGVSIMKAIEEKDDLRSVLTGVSGILEKTLGGLDTPINDLGSPATEKDEKPEMPPSQGKQPPDSTQKQEQPTQQPTQQPMQQQTQQPMQMAPVNNLPIS